MKLPSLLVLAALLASTTSLASTGATATPDRAAAIQSASPAAPAGAASWFNVPAGSSLVGRSLHGAWSLSVEPAGDPTPALGAAECDNDVPADVTWWVGWEWNGYTWVPSYSAEVVPSIYPLSLNPTWPASENKASAGTCAASSTLRGPVTYLNFQTAGDLGGRVHLDGVDANGDAGSFDVACAPAGSDTVVGAAGVWPNLIQFQEAACKATENGPEPSSYVSWSGWVENDNSESTMSTYGVAA